MNSYSPHASGKPRLDTDGRNRPAHARPSPVRRALAVSLASLVLLVACARQEEGDRCSTENDDNDCESGLVCVAPVNLRGGGDEVARCCPPQGEPISNERCTPRIGGGGTDGGGNAGGQAGETGTTGGPGTDCSYTSDCNQEAGLVCGPKGKCQNECQEDLDCITPEICNNGRCITL